MRDGAATRPVGRPQDRQLGFRDRSLVVFAPAHRGVTAVEVVAVHVWVTIVIHAVATSSLGVLRAAVARRGGVNRTGSGNSPVDTMPILVQFYVVVVPPQVDGPSTLECQGVVQDIEVPLITEREQVLQRHASPLVAFLKRSEHFGVGLLRFRHAVVGDIGGFGKAHTLDYLHFVVHRLHDVDIAVNRQSAHDD